MLIRRDIPLFGGRQSSIAAEAPFPLGAPGTRMLVASRLRSPVRPASIASAALHAAVMALLLVVVRPVLLPPPPEEHGITMVFEPAPQPAPTIEQTEPAVSEPIVPNPQAAQAPVPEPPLAASTPLAEPSTETLPLTTRTPPEEQQAKEPTRPQPVAPTESTALALPLPPPPAPPPPPSPKMVARPHAAPPAFAPPASAPQPVPTTPPPSPAATMAAQPAPVISSAWRRLLEAWLAAHKTYPEEARRRAEEGAVTLRFTVERSGLITRVAAIHGSGSQRLDDAAESMLRDATLPPFDATMPESQLTATVQIRYALQP